VTLTPKGFYVDPKEWTATPKPSYAENPPDDWEECDCCGGYHPPNYSGDCRSDINRWPSDACIKALTSPTLTRRLSWRTRKDQFYQSFGCGQTHGIVYIGACESCGRSVYSQGCIGANRCGDSAMDSPDPRGVIPAEHCMNLYRAQEYSLKGRDLVTCATCADDGDRYRAIIARAKSKGIWTAPNVTGYLCAICGKSGADHGRYDATNPNTHKFVCGEEITQ